MPLIYLRQSEMQALDELPVATKNLIIPIIRMRPWLGSKTLAKSTDRVRKAIGDRLFGFDIDPAKRGFGTGATKDEFAALFSEADNWKNYYDHIEPMANAVPVLRSKNTSNVEEEIKRIQSLDRGLIVRVEVGSHAYVSELAKALVEHYVENVLFVLDCGWHAHLLPFQAQCVGLIKTLIAIAPNAEFVVAGGDFPLTGFDNKGSHFSIEGEERSLVEAVRREINEAEIFFGDWASARPPRIDNEIRRNRPRVDMPTRTGWECWRRATPGKSYQDICASAVVGRGLGESSDLWGNQMIIGTAGGEGAAQIRSPNVAAAVRINLHMILQAHFDTGSGPTVGDELITGEL